jgi:ABC-type microcin C transport system permease subunit YejE
VHSGAHPLESLSPGQRAWMRFRANRRGRISLWIFLSLFVLSLFAEILSNDRPLIVYYEKEFYFPLVANYPEATFGGDFATPTDYLDPFIESQLQAGENWALYPLNRYSFNTFHRLRIPQPHQLKTCLAPMTAGATWQRDSSMAFVSRSCLALP